MLILRQGCKMVSIAVYIRSPPPEALNYRSRLRDLGLWYPTIPPRNVCLNEQSFPPLDFHMVGYRPLFWCHFGGTGGENLAHLTGISATSCLGILRIQFSFDKEMLAKYQSFGRLKKREYEEVVAFAINGPGGERIETIKMRHYYADPGEALPWMVQGGTMVRCKVCLHPLTLSPLTHCSLLTLFPSSFIQTAGDHASSSILPNSTAKKRRCVQQSKLMQGLPLLAFMPPRCVGLNPAPPSQ